MQRAYQTAKIISKETKNIQIDPRLREWCLGSLEAEPTPIFLNEILSELNDISSEDLNLHLPEVCNAIHQIDTTGMTETFDGIACRLKECLGDIGYAVQQYCEAQSYGVVREFVGHGIGKEMHEDPPVPNYGKRGTGTLLKKGMCIAIEPMITLGERKIVMENDRWTIRTADRKCAAHFEHTVAVGLGKADILSSFDYIEDVLKNKED